MPDPSPQSAAAAAVASVAARIPTPQPVEPGPDDDTGDSAASVTAQATGTPAKSPEVLALEQKYPGYNHGVHELVNGAPVKRIDGRPGWRVKRGRGAPAAKANHRARTAPTKNAAGQFVPRQPTITVAAVEAAPGAEAIPVEVKRRANAALEVRTGIEVMCMIFDRAEWTPADATREAMVDALDEYYASTGHTALPPLPSLILTFGVAYVAPNLHKPKTREKLATFQANIAAKFGSLRIKGSQGHPAEFPRPAA